MLEKYTTPVIFSRQQVLDFAELTEDDGPIHTVEGVVQGGLILSMMPKWIKMAVSNYQMNLVGKNIAVSMFLESKFRKKLHCDVIARVEFEFIKDGNTVNKVKWAVIDDDNVYCSGTWILHKVNNT